MLLLPASSENDIREAKNVTMNPLARRMERNRDEVRKLSQKSGNRFCIDCGIRGPLYVVTNFRVFVCSTCAALHRSLQHKVKGISMTEFTDEEVACLNIGGNDRAARVWLASYENNNKPPHGSDIAVRDFIVSAFENMSYVNREELERFQNDLKAVGTRATCSHLPHTMNLPLPERGSQRSLTSLPPEPPTTEKPSPPEPLSSSTGLQDLSSAPRPQVELFEHSTPQTLSSAPVNVSAPTTDDDFFADFVAAAAPPASSVTADIPTPQRPLDAWLTSGASAHPQVNIPVSISPGVTMGPVPYTTSQPLPAGQMEYPPSMFSQPGSQGQFGVQQEGGYGGMTRGTFLQPQPQPQQFQYAFSMGPPVGPNGVPYQAPNAQVQTPSGGSATLMNMCGVDFFQEVPANPWGNFNSPEPTKTESVKNKSEPHNEAFASLDPFSGKW
ncbi:ADP-ribosylation factor GTPase activating protein, putative [Trypanosoma cruzi marinkellei]|uniref:ADP-ribosylation factor GTPase activating protein, putative n=1 Tax=Trypanosoma cruzi marinkellei TaxID=85056 RepID=K2MRZ0_TRYCR|nr:ADP-ribosylation factor GTPase activating protein, putative [Trypanosoma cruzi marinkellei]